VIKTATSAVQLANSILFHACSRTTAVSSCGITEFWLKIKNRLRTIEAENP